MVSIDRLDHIREKLGQYIQIIQEETKWQKQREETKVEVKFGSAPEFSDDYGIVRTLRCLTFGKWILEYEPESQRETIFDDILLRESFTFFIEEELLFGEYKELTNLFLNFATICYLLENETITDFRNRSSNILQRLSFHYKNIKSPFQKHEIILCAIQYELIQQKINYQLVLEYYHKMIINEPTVNFDIKEFFIVFYKYISKSPIRMIAPVYLKEKHSRVLEELTKTGFKTTTAALGQIFQVSQSTISRQLEHIQSNYSIHWRVGYNFKKMGLYPHIAIIRSSPNSEISISDLIEELAKNNYIPSILEGQSENYKYVQAHIYSPVIDCLPLEMKLTRWINEGKIYSFDLLPISKDQKWLSITNEPFDPKLINLERLLKGDYKTKSLKIWDSSKFEDSTKMRFTNSDKSLLEFLSILIGNTLAGTSYFFVLVPELKEFLEKIGISFSDLNGMTKTLGKYQSQALERELFDYYIFPKLSNTKTETLTIILSGDIESERIQKALAYLKEFGLISFDFSHEKIVCMLQGPKFVDEITERILTILSELDISLEYYSAVVSVWRHLPFVNLYDFSCGKWNPK